MTMRINVTTTHYEGDAAFPEAEHYPQYVANELAKRYPGARIDVSFGGRTRASVYGFDNEPGRDLEYEIKTLVGVDLWNDFCAHGYREYTPDVQCECGAWTGEPCAWSGPAYKTAVVEYMPGHLRASHRATGNSGTYPDNGAIRVRAERSCADSIVKSDPDWAEIVS